MYRSTLYSYFHITLLNIMQINNLEIITQVENVNKRRIKTSSNYEGVSFHKHSKKWISRITIENKSVYLGIFLTEKEAYDKYLQIKETLL